MKKNSKIFVAGSENFIGSSIVRALRKHGYTNILGLENEQPDLRNKEAVKTFFEDAQPEYVFSAAGEIGGIGANQETPAFFMLDNLLTESNIISEAHNSGVKKLIYLASSCTYPKESKQPMKPEYLMTGPLEPTSEFYATAKLTGIKLCEAYRQQYGDNFHSVIPANPFGPGDSFDAENGHVIGALIRKIYTAQESNLDSITVWGTGTPRRDFIFIDDLGDACVFAMENYTENPPLNLSVGEDVAISDLANMLIKVSGFNGSVKYDLSKQDGMAIKLLDGSELKSLGWHPSTSMENGLEQTNKWFLANHL